MMLFLSFLFEYLIMYKPQINRKYPLQMTFASTSLCMLVEIYTDIGMVILALNCVFVIYFSKTVILEKMPFILPHSLW